MGGYGRGSRGDSVGVHGVAGDVRKWQIEPAATCSVVREREMELVLFVAEHTSDSERERGRELGKMTSWRKKK